MIAIQALHLPLDWRDPIIKKVLAIPLAILLLLAGILIFQSLIPQRDSQINLSSLPAGETEEQLFTPGHESSGEVDSSLAQPSTTKKIPSPTTPVTPLLAPLVTEAGPELSELEAYPAGSPVELVFTGPDSRGMSGQVNPFLIQADVTFTGPGGQVFVVPAFYDGDGAGGVDGSLWKVRFSPDANGVWSYKASSPETMLEGLEGSFQVVASEMCQDEGTVDLRCKGQLDYNGSHYLRFKDGDYWIKGGVDDPENFLGTAFGGWQEKKEALDYLAGQGVNSIYVITNNIHGDAGDTWPWVGATAEEAKLNSNRFDTAKLAQWEDFFSYAESKGIVLHIVLNDDGAWSEYDHELYFREMIARFGHHPGLIWNIGEEANEIYSDDEQVRLARTLRAMDPYRHPVTVHRQANWPFIGNPHFDLTSIQAGEGAEDFSVARLRPFNRIVNSHRENSASAGRPIPIMIDETPGIDRVDEEIRRKVRARLLYPIYIGGGNFELHFRDSFFEGGLDSLRRLEPLLEDMERARKFVASLPFTTMSSCNDYVSGQDAICYGAPGRVYAIYLPQGGNVRVDLARLGGQVRATWFDPRTGETEAAGSVNGGGEASFSAPGSGDWLLRLDGSGSAGCTFNRVASVPAVNVSSRTANSQLLNFQIFVPVASLCN